MMLYIDDYGKVRVHQDMVAARVVTDLMAQDQSKDKKNFDRWITYAYHMYKRDHAFSNFGPGERAQRVSSMYFLGEDISDIETINAFKDFKLVYMDMQHTVTSRFIENIKKDMEGLLEYIHKIPLSKSVLVQLDVPDGNVMVKVEKWMDIDNSKEKFDALKRAEDILNLLSKLTLKMKEEQREEKKKGGSRRMFDKRNV